jgi:hypothetical protein
LKYHPCGGAGFRNHPQYDEHIANPMCHVQVPWFIFPRGWGSFFYPLSGFPNAVPFENAIINHVLTLAHMEILQQFHNISQSKMEI